jgi:hypothetical protein
MREGCVGFGQGFVLRASVAELGDVLGALLGGGKERVKLNNRK